MVQGSIPSRSRKLFSSPKIFRLVLQAIQPPNPWVLRELPPMVKQLGCEVDHSPPSSAEVTNMGSYISTPSTSLYAGHKDNFIFGQYSGIKTGISQIREK
jgi:hypothetical protein